MLRTLVACIACIAMACPARALLTLPELPAANLAPASYDGDWLVSTPPAKAGIYRGDDAREIVMTNGLVRRVWRITPNCATVAFDNLMTGDPIIRGVKPEALIELDGRRYKIGGLNGQPDYAYLKREWVDSLKGDTDAFQIVGIETGQTIERFPWKRVRRHDAALAWPPRGVSLTFHYAPPQDVLPDLTVSVHYEMYDGIPLVAKWISIANNGKKPIQLDTFTSEILAAVEVDSSVDVRDQWNDPNIHVETDFGYGGAEPSGARRTVYWVPDPQYTTQVNYTLQSPVLLECRLPIGPDVSIAPGNTFTSFRTFELLLDTTERERRGLAVRRMYRIIAPWVTENPIMLHVRHSDPESVRLAIDQCADVGAEMAILSFGSGLNMESDNPDYIAKIKSLVDYAHSKGVQLGGYSLLASRKISPDDDVINPATGKTGGAIFGESPCLCSKWGQEYFRKLKNFIEQTGMDLLEHDGSYPGDRCASTSHPGHKGLNDSLWNQYQAIADLYAWCRARGVFLNVPDWYMLSGSNKTGMGYREVNWSLPRERQLILGRQNIFDGTWGKTPTMGWMFVPLVEYQGGGEAATLEPLSQHLDAYGAHLAQNFGAGVQACYRGTRWYDSDETKAVVLNWINFFKRYRDILESDIIHVRRPDGRDLDCILHVNPNTTPRALAMVFNPLGDIAKKTITLPIYYSGLSTSATVRVSDGPPMQLPIDREYRIHVPLEILANKNAWITIE